MTEAIQDALRRADALHKQCMSYFDDAALLRLERKPDAAIESLRTAFRLQREAADHVAGVEFPEPSRSIYHKGAVSLAIQIGDYDAARELIARAFSGSPPPSIAGELREMLEELPIVPGGRLSSTPALPRDLLAA